MAENARLGLRRLRQNQMIRELVQEYRVSVEQMIQPVFIVEGLSSPEPVPGLTGVFRETSETILRTIEKDLEAGVKKFMIFGVPREKKSKDFDPSFTVDQITSLRRHFGKDILLTVDLCLCSSTTHGHCGVLNVEGDHVDNSSTVEELARIGLAYAQAGADAVVPSDMMDGRVGAIRSQLDQAGLEKTMIISHAAKFSSRFYGPFRIAADCAPKEGNPLKDRSTYQLDSARLGDAYSCAIRDAEEGADILMVKPGLPYLDILFRLSSEIQKPWAVYEVSGEYAGIELLAQNGLINGPAAHVEAWTAFVRAGASVIVTYGARFARQYLGSI